MSTQATLVRPMMNWATAAASRTADDMFLTTWGMENLAAYVGALTFAQRLRKGVIPPGSITARVPKTWKSGSETHEAGAELLGMDFETGYEEYSLEERPLITHNAFDSVDLLKASYEIRGPVTTAQGVELAKQADKRAWTIVLNAAITANDTDDSFPGAVTDATVGISGGIYTNNDLDVLHYGSSTFTAANISTAVDALLAGLDGCNLVWDDLDVPKENRHCAVDNKLFNACRKYGLAGTPVAQSSNTFGGTPNLNPFGAPAITQGLPYAASFNYNGIEVFNSPNSPWNTNIATGPAKWRVDGSNVRALAFHTDAAVWVDWMGPMAEMEYSVAKQQWLIASKVMHGGGTLRPYCAIAFKGNGS